MSYWAYLRVSTDKQDCLRQREIIKNSDLDIPADHIKEENESGGKSYKDRKILFSLITKEMSSGDCLVVSELARLSRSVRDVLNIVNQLKKKRLGFRSIKEPMLNFDENTKTSDFPFAMWGCFGQMEREFIQQRVKDGMAARKAEGKLVARPSELFNKRFISYYRILYGKDKEIQEKPTPRMIMKELGIKKDTFYKYCRLISERYHIYLRSSKCELPEEFWQERLMSAVYKNTRSIYHTPEEVSKICQDNMKDFEEFCKANIENYISGYRLFIQEDGSVDRSFKEVFSSLLLNGATKSEREESIISWYEQHKAASKSQYVQGLFSRLGDRGNVNE